MDGGCRQRGRRLANVKPTSPIPLADATTANQEAFVLICEHEGTVLTVKQAVAAGPPQVYEVIKVFHGVPEDW